MIDQAARRIDELQRIRASLPQTPNAVGFEALAVDLTVTIFIGWGRPFIPTRVSLPLAEGSRFRL